MKLWEERKKRQLRSISKAENRKVSSSEFNRRSKGTSRKSFRFFNFQNPKTLERDFF